MVNDADMKLKMILNQADICQSSTNLFSYLRGLPYSQLKSLKEECGLSGLAERWNCNLSALSNLFSGRKRAHLIEERFGAKAACHKDISDSIKPKKEEHHSDEQLLSFRKAIIAEWRSAGRPISVGEADEIRSNHLEEPAPHGREPTGKPKKPTQKAINEIDL